MSKSSKKKPDRPYVAPPTPKALSDAMLASPLMDVSDWHSVVAVSLNFKEQLFNDAGGVIRLTEELCRNELVMFGKRLDKAVYNRAAFRFGKQVRRIVYLEKGDARSWHAHLTIEQIERVVDVKFRKSIRESWERSPWSVTEMDIQFGADPKWIEYSAKVRSKRDLISWTDSLVIEACVFGH